MYSILDVLAILNPISPFFLSRPPWRKLLRLRRKTSDPNSFTLSTGNRPLTSGIFLRHLSQTFSSDFGQCRREHAPRWGPLTTTHSPCRVRWSESPVRQDPRLPSRPLYYSEKTENYVNILSHDHFYALVAHPISTHGICHYGQWPTSNSYSKDNKDWDSLRLVILTQEFMYVRQIIYVFSTYNFYAESIQRCIVL